MSKQEVNEPPVPVRFGFVNDGVLERPEHSKRAFKVSFPGRVAASRNPRGPGGPHVRSSQGWCLRRIITFVQGTTG